jgi:hypothetical protein
MMQRALLSTAIALAVLGGAAIARADVLTGKMARFNDAAGGPWTCSTKVPAIGDRAAHTDTSTATFETVPGNVVHYHIAGVDYSGDFYVGYNPRGGVYWQTGADSLGMHAFLTSSDALTYNGTSSLGTIDMQDTITYAKTGPNTRSAHEVLTGKGSQTVFDTTCSRP